jgi:hypothetical protein
MEGLLEGGLGEGVTGRGRTQPLPRLVVRCFCHQLSLLQLLPVEACRHQQEVTLSVCLSACLPACLPACLCGGRTGSLRALVRVAPVFGKQAAHISVVACQPLRAASRAWALNSALQAGTRAARVCGLAACPTMPMALRPPPCCQAWRLVAPLTLVLLLSSCRVLNSRPWPKSMRALRAVVAAPPTVARDKTT